MPEKEKLAWLSMKRRSTTGGVKTINGQMAAVIEEDGGKGDATVALSPTNARPASQPEISRDLSNGTKTDGNLFYAYARKGDDLRSRFLLTFASAAIANEWWLLVQAHFPACSRPGAQLFSFSTPDLLAKAWRHPAFQRLKNSWMYTTFSGATADGMGGPALGIIPVQDAQGNMIGSNAFAGPTPGVVIKQEAVADDMRRLEDRLERMMDAVEQNTETVRKLTEARHEQEEKAHGAGSGLSAQFGLMTDLMRKTMAHVESLAEKQIGQEERLTQALENISAKQQGDATNLTQLTSHLDRIQNLMEKTATSRRDSVSSPTRGSSSTDFVASAAGLEKMQQAIERNSTLTEKVYDDRWKIEAELQSKVNLELLPLVEQLEKIRTAIEQQNMHSQALFEWSQNTSTEMKTSVDNSTTTLEQILSAQHATTAAVEQNGGDVDFTDVAAHMESIRDETAENTVQIRELVSLQQQQQQQRTQTNIKASPPSQLSTETDGFSPEPSTRSLEPSQGYFYPQTITPSGTGDTKFIMSALTSHLSRIQALTEQNAAAIKAVREASPPQPQGPASTATPPLPAMMQETNERLQALIHTLAPTKPEAVSRKRVDVQLQDLIAGQKAMVQAVRAVAGDVSESLKEARRQERDGAVKGSCEHVVIPPPRKVGRRIVGFVYDNNVDRERGS